jgi:hypothetical protein
MRTCRGYAALFLRGIVSPAGTHAVLHGDGIGPLQLLALDRLALEEPVHGPNAPAQAVLWNMMSPGSRPSPIRDKNAMPVTRITSPSPIGKALYVQFNLGPKVGRWRGRIKALPKVASWRCRFNSRIGLPSQRKEMYRLRTTRSGIRGWSAAPTGTASSRFLRLWPGLDEWSGGSGCGALRYWHNCRQS